LIGRLGKVVSGQQDEAIPDFLPDHALVTYNRDVAIQMMQDWEMDPRYREKAVKLTAAALPRMSVERHSPYARRQREMLEHLKAEGIVDNLTEIA
jgi:hypothetical protein